MRVLIALALLGSSACATSRPKAERPAPASSPASPSATVPRSALFREIDVQPHGMIRLGAPFTQQLTLGREVGPGRFMLVAQGMSFGGTDSLLVEVDPEGKVLALRFVYPATYDFAHNVAEYTSALGDPVRRTVVDSAGGYLERVRWADAQTEFLLQQFRHGRLGVRTWSVLRDRAAAR
jgi:hypothetical protein